MTQLVGRWRLDAYSMRLPDGTLVPSPVGGARTGSLVYTAGGGVAAQLAAGDRPNFASADPAGGDDAERMAAFATYIAYWGTYEVDGDTVVHRLEGSLFPNWVGTELRRTFKIAGQVLVLRTLPFEVRGTPVVIELRWLREES